MVLTSSENVLSQLEKVCGELNQMLKKGCGFWNGSSYHNIQCSKILLKHVIFFLIKGPDTVKIIDLLASYLLWHKSR